MLVPKMKTISPEFSKYQILDQCTFMPGAFWGPFCKHMMSLVTLSIFFAIIGGSLSKYRS